MEHCKTEMGKVNMGLGWITDTRCFTRKFRWLLEIEDVTPGTNDPGATANVLPPKKSARPSVDFKDMEVQHLSETIYFPGKAEWKPINLVIWDYPLGSGKPHPVFEWVRRMYRPDRANDDVFNPSIEFNTKVGKSTLGSTTFNNSRFKRTATLSMLSGCGDIIEKWIFENSYPQSVNFGDLDMGNGELLTAEISLRYDRAYWVKA